MAQKYVLTEEDQKFLEKCEEELKDRYTEKDEEFMKVFTMEPSVPPVVESWWPPNNSNRRNDRRFNRRYNVYEGHRNRDSDRRDNRDNDRRDNRHHDRTDNRDYQRGYNDYQDYEGNTSRDRFRHRRY